MEMIELKDWFPSIEGELRQVPPSEIRIALRDALDEFFRGTQLWQFQVDDITLVASEPLVTLAIEPNSRLAGITWMEQNGLEILPKGTEWLNDNISGWRTEEGAPLYYFIPDVDQIRLIYTPNSAAITEALEVDAYLTIGENGMEVPLWVYLKYRQVITAGAKAKLMLEEDVPWSNPRRGDKLEDRFLMGISEGRLDKAKGGTLEELEHQAVSFGGIIDF